MAPPVWVLSVDLQTKTATFQTGMAEAAKSARGAFSEIRSGAAEAGRETGFSMMEARHSVMILGEEFGVHLPRALAGFIASLGPIGPALEAAFPFMAIALGASLLIEHLSKMHEAGEKLTEDQMKFGTAANSAFNSLHEKLIQAQIRADELRNDHLGALKLQLELINQQSMGELIHSFEELAKTSETVMKGLEGHWYTWGKGSEGAKHALDEFQLQYENLISQNKGDEASGLLHTTLTQGQKVLSLMQQVQTAGRDNPFSAFADPAKFHAAAEELRKMGIAFSPDTMKKQADAQEQLVSALQRQVAFESELKELKKDQGDNAGKQVSNEESARAAAGARQAAESRLRISEQSLAADRATAEALLTIHRASLEQRLSVDLDFAARDRDAKLAANAAEISALDKSGKDYQNQLKGLQEKTLEISQEYATKEAELRSKSSVDIYNRELRDLEQSEREKIGAVREGTAARIAEIDVALKIEEQKGLQDTNFYRELLNMRVEAVRKAAEEEQKISDLKTEAEIDGIKRAADEQIKQRAALINLQNHGGSPQDLARIDSERQIFEMTYDLKRRELEQELALYREMGAEKFKEAQKTQQAIDLLEQQHVDEARQLDIQQAADVRASLAQVGNEYAQTFLQIMTGHRTLAKTMEGLTDQAASHMIAAAFQMMAGDKETQLSHAKAAAAGAYNAMANIPIIGPELGAVAAATVFAGAMAFEGGTDSVPGYGRGDVVPAMLAPQEGVVPGGVMDGLRKVAARGGFDGGGPRYNVTTHVHMHASALDSDGMDEVLEKHSEKLQHHFEKTLRRMNR